MGLKKELLQGSEEPQEVRMWGWGLAAGRLCLSELCLMGVWGGSWWSPQQDFEGKGGGGGEATAGVVKGNELGAQPRAVFCMVRYGCWIFFFFGVMNPGPGESLSEPDDRTAPGLSVWVW